MGIALKSLLICKTHLGTRKCVISLISFFKTQISVSMGHSKTAIKSLQLNAFSFSPGSLYCKIHKLKTEVRANIFHTDVISLLQETQHKALQRYLQ